jgi:hypothetical protein
MAVARNKRLRVFLPFILALVAAPILPAFAAPMLAPAPALDAHAHHDLQAPDQSSPCAQHADCLGYCCSACAHCAAAAANPATDVDVSATVSPSTIPVLHAFFVPSRINRPPQAA